MSTSLYDRSINLFDMNGTLIAEFMLMNVPGENDRPWVKVIPTYSAMKWYENDPASQAVTSLAPGMTMYADTFLGYIGNVANEGSKLPYPFKMVSNEVTLVLTTGLSIDAIHKLTGWDLEYITNFYKDYLVFG